MVSPFGVDWYGLTPYLVADLTARPSGMFYGNAPDYRSYEREGFRTPTGKVEFYSHVLASYGYDPLPHYEEPAESPFSTPELAQATTRSS